MAFLKFEGGLSLSISKLIPEKLGGGAPIRWVDLHQFHEADTCTFWDISPKGRGEDTVLLSPDWPINQLI